MEYKFSLKDTIKNDNIDIFYVNVDIMDMSKKSNLNSIVVVKFDNNTGMILTDNIQLQKLIPNKNIRLNLICALKQYIREEIKSMN